MMNLIMTPTELAAAVGALIFAVGLLLGGAGKLFLALFRRELDTRFSALEAARQHATEQWSTRFEFLDAKASESERRVTQLLINLPLQYQRREDAIRQETAVIYRLDALNGKVDDRLAALAEKIDAIRVRPTHEPSV